MNIEKNQTAQTQDTPEREVEKDFRYYLSQPRNTNKMVPAAELSDAFIEGYLAAIRRHRIYDDPLNLQGHQLYVHVMGELLFAQKKTEDAIRAQSRVIVNTYGKDMAKKATLRSMVFDTDTITDESKPTIGNDESAE